MYYIYTYKQSAYVAKLFFPSFFSFFLGVILVDAMKLSKALNFSKKDLKILGFVDLDS